MAYSIWSFINYKISLGVIDVWCGIYEDSLKDKVNFYTMLFTSVLKDAEFYSEAGKVQ